MMQNYFLYSFSISAVVNSGSPVIEDMDLLRVISPSVIQLHL